MRLLLLIIFAPILVLLMIPIGALLLGLGAGLFGVVVGVLGALFGIIVAFFATIFGGLFAIGLGKAILFLIIVVTIGLLISRRPATK